MFGRCPTVLAILVLLAYFSIPCLADIQCSDPKYSCPDNTTCCQGRDKSGRCCPLENAVCCKDGIHCCPKDTVCNLQNGTCHPADFGNIGRPPLVEPGLLNITNYHPPPSQNDILCPDHESTCPDKTTCCQLPTKQWGCCPIEHAVCCSDGLHCCPQHTKCNLQTMSCDNATAGQTGRTDWWQTEPTNDPPHQVDVICPDGHKTCPGDNTCCMQGNPPAWGCCQFPHAVCCEDHIHCCPHGSVCNGSQCVMSGSERILVNAQKLTSKQVLGTNVECADGTHCGDQSTCCLSLLGDWECCPYPNGVCCPDQTHCCPNGTTCDATSGYCWYDSKKGTKWMTKYKSINSNGQDLVKCPDHKTVCPDGTTCCKTSATAYGCCPLPKAVCCSDNLHCCPSGTTCDIPAQACKPKRSASFPWFTKFKP